MAEESPFHPIVVPSPLGKEPNASTHIRIARPSTDLKAAEVFYVSGLGLEVLFRKTYMDNEHEHSILMLGFPGAAWHLELVSSTGEEDFPRPAPSEEDLFVLYLDGKVDEKVVKTALEMGGKLVKSRNPYWDECGVTLADPDGYRVVLTVRAWENKSWTG